MKFYFTPESKFIRFSTFNETNADLTFTIDLTGIKREHRKIKSILFDLMSHIVREKTSNYANMPGLEDISCVPKNYVADSEIFSLEITVNKIFTCEMFCDVGCDYNRNLYDYKDGWYRNIIWSNSKDIIRSIFNIADLCENKEEARTHIVHSLLNFIEKHRPKSFSREKLKFLFSSFTPVILNLDCLTDDERLFLNVELNV